MASLKTRHHMLVAIMSVLILVVFMAVPAFADHSDDSDRGRGHDDRGCGRDKDDHDGRDYDDYGNHGDDESDDEDDGTDGDDGDDTDEGDDDAKADEENGRRCDKSDDKDEPEPSPSPSAEPADDDDADEGDDGSGSTDDSAEGSDAGRTGGDAGSNDGAEGGTTDRTGDGSGTSTKSATTSADIDATRTTERVAATSPAGTNESASRPSGPLTCPAGTDFAWFLTGSLADCDVPGMGGGWSGTFLAAQGTKVCPSGPYKGMPTLDLSECQIDKVRARILRLPLTGAGGLLPMVMIALVLMMMGAAALRLNPRT